MDYRKKTVTERGHNIYLVILILIERFRPSYGIRYSFYQAFIVKSIVKIKIYVPFIIEEKMYSRRN